MSIIERWKRWRLFRKNRRESDAISKRQREESRLKYREEQLKKTMNEVDEALTKIGFKCSEHRSRGDEFEAATSVVVAPNGEALRLIVFPRGGYRIESL